MNDAICQLSNRDLQSLIAALRAGRIGSPCSELQLERYVPPRLRAPVRDALLALSDQGFSAGQIAAALELIDLDRQNCRTSELPIDLVTSGPEAPGITNRDTSVVVRELFAHAKKSVLLVGYAVYQGNQVFESLARQMELVPELDVQFFLNISRPDRDKSTPEMLVARFKQRFTDLQWPHGCRLPAVFYDPRSIDDQAPVRSSLHAKCVVVDAEHVFVSSANFTEAAQERNIEVGLNIRSRWLAEQLIRHFKMLHESKLVVRAF